MEAVAIFLAVFLAVISMGVIVMVGLLILGASDDIGGRR